MNDDTQHLATRGDGPKPRIEAMAYAILTKLGYRTTRFEGRTCIVNVPGKLANLVGLFVYQLELADDLVDDLKELLEAVSKPAGVAEDLGVDLEPIRERLAIWDKPIQLVTLDPVKVKKGT